MRPTSGCARIIFFFGLFFLLLDFTKYVTFVIMNSATKAKNRHEAGRDALLRKIGMTGPFVEGSLNAVRRHGCREPGWQLTWKQAGKTRTVYVPMALVPEVKAWVAQHRKLKSLVRKVTAKSLAIIRNHTARRRAAARAPASITKP
jgi:hypothetical protein